MAAPALSSRSTLALACRLWLAAMLAIAGIATITVVAGPGPVREALGFTFPARPHVADFAVVAVHNVVLTGALLVAAHRPCREIDALIMTAAVANLALAGLALGAYGPRLLAHAGMYGAIELAAFSVALAVYLDARFDRHEPTVLNGLVTALLVLGSAALETVAAVHV